MGGVHGGPGLALTGATLVDGSGRPPRENVRILIRSGRFIAVGNAADVPAPEGWELLHARGKWILPGLVDAHAHVSAFLAGRFDPDQGEDSGDMEDRLLGRFLSNGVTTVRCTGGPSLETFSAMKQGKPTWPRFFGAGPNLDGEPGGPWPGIRIVRTPQEASEQTRALIDGGVDFIKLYVWMLPDAIRAVCDTAHERGVRVAAHVGTAVTVEQAVRIGVDALEHVRIGRELLDDEQLRLLDQEPKRRKDEIFDFRAWRYVDLASPRTDTLLDLLVETGVCLTPTFCVTRAVLEPTSSTVTGAVGMDTVPESMMEAWERDRYTIDYSDEDFRWGRTELRRQLEFVGMAHERGVPILAGSDTPNPFVPPGDSLHDELALLTAAGLSPGDALVAATRRPFEFLGEDARLGTVTPGKAADCVVLDADPLADIANTRSIAAVIKGGELLIDNVGLRAGARS